MFEEINIKFPQFAHFGHVIDLFHHFQIYDIENKQVTLDLPEECYLTTEAMAFLCTWGLAQKEKGSSIVFGGESDVLNYLSRMDLFEHLEVNYKEQFNRHNETGRFIPLRLIRDFTDVTQATDDICELVIHQFENAHEFLPALEWAVNEVIDNVYNHACISTPAAICGQYYPKNKRLEIAIVDSGRGIKASLAESFDLPNDEAALGKAMQRGITRNKDEGQGNGLAGTREIVLKNGGSLRLWSGNSQYHISKGVEQGFHTIPYMQGTGVLIKLNTEQPVDLSDTFIGETDWSYINVLCEEIEEAGSLKVSEEVINTFTREAGRRLRLKIDSLLPEMEGPLVLDFQGIDMATSSFMDELFGKLYLKYGDDYSIRIKAININTILQSILSMLSMTLYDRAEKQI
jgi:anti-sigma regulatory factor (Ser/Thr protein kinase)